jgi:hypothetical protein
MGLPLGLSCGGATPVPNPDIHVKEKKQVPVKVAEAEVGQVHKGGAHAVPAQGCGADEYHESVCGGAPQGCGPTARGLASTSNERLPITKDFNGDPSLFTSFHYDEAASAAYQQSGNTPALRTPGSFCCYSQCTELTVATYASPPFIDEGYQEASTCLPAPPNGTKVPSQTVPQCPTAVEVGGVIRPLARGDAGECCYQTVEVIPPPPRHYRGRAARVAGVTTTAEVQPSGEWLTRDLALEELDASLKERLSAAWLSDAKMEHASIAAFSELSLELLALAAPSPLVHATHRAAMDEVTHAEMTFAVASAYGARDLGPSAFTEATQMRASGDIVELALETFVDGCIGETVAACVAESAALVARDPVIVSVQKRIAEDETRHAELAWAILAWCVEQVGPSIHEPLREALANASVMSSDIECTDCDLNEHGMPCRHDEHRIRTEVLGDVVAPCLEALLSCNA